MLLVPLLLLIGRKRGRPVSRPVWIPLLAAPVLVAVIGAAGARG